VRLSHLDLKLAHGADDEGGEQRGTIGAVEAVEGAPKAIVAEEASLPWLEAKVFGDASGDPPGEAVEGTACEQEVGDEDAEGDGGREVFGASGRGRQVACKQLLKLETVEDVTDDRGGANFQGFE
jgi:hypothetical protein